MQRVLVTDGRSKASVPIVRSLGRKGIEVTAANDKKVNPAFFSKYVKNRVIYPTPEKKPDLFVSEIYELIKKERYDVVIPVRDATTILFSKYKHKFSNFTKIPIPNYETVMKGRDIAQTVKITLENDIPCPKTYFVENEDSINKIKNKIDFPVLIRARESSGSRGIVYVDSPEKFIYEYKNVSGQYGAVMIQEYIPHMGDAYNVSALFNQYSEPRAAFVLKKIRQYPITGGPTAFAESVERPELIKYALKLLKTLNWIGVAEVEFLFDERDKTPKLLEINPRFWDPLSLAIESGIDFPYLLYQMAINGDVEPVNSYKVGVKWCFLISDVLCYLSTPNKLKMLPEFLKFHDENLHYAIFSLSDPGPAVGIILKSLIAMFYKEERMHVFNRGWGQNKSGEIKLKG